MATEARDGKMEKYECIAMCVRRWSHTSHHSAKERKGPLFGVAPFKLTLATVWHVC